MSRLWPRRSEPLRILHLEDSRQDAAMILDRLHSDGLQCDVVLVETQDQFESALNAGGIDLILAGYTLPDYDGIAALKFARGHSPDVPVILVSGTLGEDTAVECLRDGATDYLLKAQLERLVPAVRRALTEASVRRGRLEAEGALSKSESRKAAVLDSVMDCIITMDPNGVVIEFNAAAVRTFGYSKAEAIGRPLADLIVPPQFRAMHTNGLRRYLATGRSTLIGRLIEVTAVRADGSEIPVELTITAIGSGPTAEFTGVLRDITSRRQGDANRTRLAAIVDTSDDAIISMALDQTILTWNAGAEQLYGYAAADVVGMSCAFLVPPDKRDELVPIMERARRGQHGVPLETNRLRKDGTCVEVSLVTSPMTDSAGRVDSVSTIARDITARHLLEEQYQQAQKMEAVGRLAAGVAHDFNNLLTVILGFANLLLSDLEPADARRADLMEIRNAGGRAADLTRQLLAFSRKEIIQPTLLDLNAIVTEIRGMLGRLIGEDVTVDLKLGAGLALVKADRGQIEQIVVNLAVNARDAMPGGGTLTIETANADCAQAELGMKPGPCVVLTVTDTGTGIAPDVQARLFEPFFTTKGVGKGTGLGLATVHGAVSQSGGRVTVESEVGKGTAFTVYFPQATPVQPGVATPPPVAAAIPDAIAVLVVEDEAALRQLLKRLLQGLGYTVVVAANADEALERFSEHPAIALLLTDVVMPGASGPALVLQLVAQRPALKVIYMSGYTDDAIVHHGVLDPGIAFLTKPFSLATLDQKIREVLKQPAVA